jgi:hypothetical protein
MLNELHPKSDPGGTMIYQIRVKGQLNPQWTGRFEDIAINKETK